MQLRVLGCSGGTGPGLRTTSYLLDKSILIDAGTGVGDLSLEEACAVRHVFLTHSHLDHVAGLPLLVDTVFCCLSTALIVHAQPVTIQALKDHLLNWTIWPDFAELPDKDNAKLAYAPMEVGDVVEVDGRTFEMIPGNHVVPSVAYVVSDGEKTFCFSGDTTTNDTLWAGLNARESLDLLIVECAFPNKLEELAGLAKHYCPKLLAADLAKLQHRPRLGITHLQSGGEDLIYAECEEAIRGFDMFRLTHGALLEP